MKMFLGHPTKCSRTEKCFSGHSKYVYILKMFSGGTKINVHARKMFLELILECTGIFPHLGKHIGGEGGALTLLRELKI